MSTEELSSYHSDPESEDSHSEEENEGCVFIFIIDKEEEESEEVKSISGELDKNNYYFVSKIPLKNKKMKDWLQSNQYGIVIDELPVFLYKDGNKDTKVFYYDQFDDFLKICSKYAAQMKT